MCDNGLEYGDSVDPRVQVELERLNNATDSINKLEVDLDEARASFRQLLCESTARVEALRQKLGLCVDRAKPYYEARFGASEAQQKTRTAAVRYEKANSAHSAAREMVYLAEQGLGGRTLDPAWQEMLNHATQRVNEAERERGFAETEHRLACIKHDAANARVQTLQKELKRAIAKSSLSARRSLMQLNIIAYQHQLLLLPYYETKAQFNKLLEAQRGKVQTLESQVCNAKLTYADALHNLEQISDEIHRARSKTKRLLSSVEKTKLPEPIASFPSTDHEHFDDDEEEYRPLPPKLGSSASPIKSKMEEIEGYRNVSPVSESKPIAQSQSGEWTEINLEVSSPEEDIPYHRLDSGKPKLVKQVTLPNPVLENDYVQKSKAKLDANIANWISRSSAKEQGFNAARRQSLDNILGPTGEKVKEILSQGMMMLNISSLTERRNSEPRPSQADDKSRPVSKKIPSPLEKTLTYLTAEDDISDTESLSSVDMLSEDQINSLMLDKDIDNVCEQVLGTPISDVCPAKPEASGSSQQSK